MEVYYNLHRKCLSIKDRRTHKVIGYAKSIRLKDASFKVSQAGRSRVLREGRKNVHATIQGAIAISLKQSNQSRASYNPYKFSQFVDTATLYPVLASPQVWVLGNHIYYNPYQDT